MIPFFIAAVNEAKVCHDDADHFLDDAVLFAPADLLNEHFCLVKADALENIERWSHLHFDVYLLAGLGLDANVQDAQLFAAILLLEVGIQKHKAELIVGQVKYRLQKALEQHFVALIAKDELEQKIVFGEEYLPPVGCFDNSHGINIPHFCEKGKCKKGALEGALGWDAEPPGVDAEPLGGVNSSRLPLGRRLFWGARGWGVPYGLGVSRLPGGQLNSSPVSPVPSVGDFLPLWENVPRRHGGHGGASSSLLLANCSFVWGLDKFAFAR
jgi:hypothetical protein